MRLAFVPFAVLVVAISSYFAFSPSNEGTALCWVLAIVPQALLAAVGAYWAWQDGLLAEWLSPHWGDASLAALQALGSGAVAWAGMRLVFSPGTDRHAFLLRLYIHLGDPRIFTKHLALMGLVLLVAALAEETLWRGVIPYLLEEKVGSSRAWLYSLPLYALAQVPTAFAMRDQALGPNPVLPLAALGCGAVWAFASRRTGRLLPSVLGHALFGWAVIIGYRLAGPAV